MAEKWNEIFYDDNSPVNPVKQKIFKYTNPYWNLIENYSYLKIWKSKLLILVIYLSNIKLFLVKRNNYYYYYYAQFIVTI